MRALCVPDVGDRLLAELLRARYSPAHHHQFTLVVTRRAYDRGRIVREDRGQGWQVARAVAHRADELPDGLLAFGEAVEVANATECDRRALGVQAGRSLFVRRWFLGSAALSGGRFLLNNVQQIDSLMGGEAI